MVAALRVQELGPFLLGERLGVGGMAEVFAAESQQHGKIALKRILPGLAKDPEFVDMFWDEARITSHLSHPNVMRILDYGRVGSEIYMALEYVGGPSLARLIRNAARKRLKLSPALVLGLIVELLDALHYVHTAKSEDGAALDIVHRDVSPGNVMLTLDAQVKLGDFGILRSQAVIRRTQPGELKGKMGYMSPEQALGSNVTPQSDLFSVGIILAEFLTLRPLFLGRNEMETLSSTATADLSAWHSRKKNIAISLQAIVEKSLKLDVSDRYLSAAAMKEAIEDVAIVNGWTLNRDANLLELRRLGLLSKERQVSGERRVVSRGDGQEAGPTAAEGEFALALTPIEGVAFVPFRPEGSPVWRASFSQISLPKRLFDALRRSDDSVVELRSIDGSRFLHIEQRRGRIIAIHDSKGRQPLGRMLVEASLLSSAELDQAVIQSRRAGQRLGRYLIAQGRLRESVLLRLLEEQAGMRLGEWFAEKGGKIALYSETVRGGEDLSELDSASLATLVAAMRKAIRGSSLKLYLDEVAGAIVIPATGAQRVPLALTDPERRALTTVLEGGAYEECSVRAVVHKVEDERIARRSEVMFALLVALSAGILLAPGFGR